MSLCTEYVMAGAGTHGFFYIFGSITLIGAIWCTIYVKESKGLSDQDKKSLYEPKEIDE